MEEDQVQKTPSLLSQYLEMGEPGTERVIPGRKLAFGASRGLADRESVRKTAQLLADAFKNKLMQPDQGRQYEETINTLLNSNKDNEAFQVADQGIKYLKDEYKIYIG